MKLEDCVAGQTIRVKLIEGFADAYVVNNLPSKNKIALIIKLGVRNGKRYNDSDWVLNYNDDMLADFEILNSGGQRAPNKTDK